MFVHEVLAAYLVPHRQISLPRVQSTQLRMLMVHLCTMRRHACAISSFLTTLKRIVKQQTGMLEQLVDELVITQIVCAEHKPTGKVRGVLARGSRNDEHRIQVLGRGAAKIPGKWMLLWFKIGCMLVLRGHAKQDAV